MRRSPEAAGLDVAAVLSLLHEAADHNSATRRFRGEPVLKWTLGRLRRAERIRSVAVVCWEDQLPAVRPVASELGAGVLAKGPRVVLPRVEAVAAARRWADGWRGGPLATCDFDLGFHAPWVREAGANVGARAVLLVDPSSALVDPELLDAVVAHAETDSDAELVFAPAAPGLCGPLVRLPLLDRLAAANTHPGRLLHYHPDVISREPLASDACVPVPTPVARTTHRFALSSDRQIARLAGATESLNGQLASTGAESLVRLLNGWDMPDGLPREVVLELNTGRASRPVFRAGRYHNVVRPELSMDVARALIDELAGLDDTRLTLGGLGDPLLADNVFEVIAAARSAGCAVHVETDLLCDDQDVVRRVAASEADVISVHLPAVTEGTYEAVMGTAGYRRVLENLQALVAERAARGRGVPVVVPVFTKCRDNLAEMEPWYDQWLRALGSAVIVGPSDCAGQIPDVAVADMAPPRRGPCARLASRVTVLSDGRIVSCEQDVLGRQVLGRVRRDSLREVWQGAFAAMRAEHRRGGWTERPLCASCREWHRA